MTYQTCGEISCEECNDRYEKALARIAELEKQLLLAQTKVRTVDAALTARNGALEQMVREFLAEDVAAPNIDNASPEKQYAYFIEMYAMMISALIRSASQGERFTAQELLDKVAKRIFQGVMYDARRVS